jgi:hypothetical protein
MKTVGLRGWVNCSTLSWQSRYEASYLDHDCLRRGGSGSGSRVQVMTQLGGHDSTLGSRVMKTVGLRGCSRVMKTVGSRGWVNCSTLSWQSRYEAKSWARKQEFHEGCIFGCRCEGLRGMQCNVGCRCQGVLGYSRCKGTLSWQSRYEAKSWARR